MTVKQIAEFAVSKPEQTVRNWIRSLASKSDVIKSKLDASSPAHPADYDLYETCQIIEEGLGKAAADVFRTNASDAELEKQRKTDARTKRLPSGAQMQSMLKIYTKEELARRFDYLMGYSSKQQKPEPLQLVTPEEVQPMLEGFRLAHP